MLEIHFDRRSRWLIRVEQIGSRFVVSLLREFNFKMKQILQHVFICLRVKFSRETNKQQLFSFHDRRVIEAHGHRFISLVFM